ncbi:MAG: hypothetical protein R2705_01225 [Ilumatobacteraceae bacterium]
MIGTDGAPFGTVTSDADGLATFALTDTPALGVLAASGDDSSFLPAGYYGDTLTRWGSQDEARWYVFEPRGIHRPGEAVELSGWVRRFTTSTDGQLRLFAPGATVKYSANDTMGNELASGTAEITPNGGFSIAFDLPDGANTGWGWINLELVDAGVPGYSGQQLLIEEYRTPEFSVTARTDSPEPYVSTRPATVAVDAEYYAGGPLANAPVTWSVTTSDGAYSPPGWDQYTFGVWTPWWYAESSNAVDLAFDSGPCCFPGGETEVTTYEGTTDASGSHYLQIDFEAADGTLPDLAKVVRANAAVQDLNRQTWASDANLVSTPPTTTSVCAAMQCSSRPEHRSTSTSSQPRSTAPSHRAARSPSPPSVSNGRTPMAPGPKSPSTPRRATSPRRPTRSSARCPRPWAVSTGCALASRTTTVARAEPNSPDGCPVPP